MHLGCSWRMSQVSERSHLHLGASSVLLVQAALYETSPALQPRAPASSRPLYQLSSASFTCLQSSSSHEDLSLLSFRVAPAGLSGVKVRVKVITVCVCLLLMALLTCCSLSARSSLSWLTSCFQLSADLFSPLWAAGPPPLLRSRPYPLLTR